MGTIDFGIQSRPLWPWFMLNSLTAITGSKCSQSRMPSFDVFLSVWCNFLFFWGIFLYTIFNYCFTHRETRLRQINLLHQFCARFNTFNREIAHYVLFKSFSVLLAWVTKFCSHWFIISGFLISCVTACLALSLLRRTARPPHTAGMRRWCLDKFFLTFSDSFSQHQAM